MKEFSKYIDSGRYCFNYQGTSWIQIVDGKIDEEKSLKYAKDLLEANPRFPVFEEVLNFVRRKPEYINLIQFFTITKADLNTRENCFFLRALHYAAKYGTKEIIQALIAAGVNPDAKDDWLGWRALHYAAKYGTKEIIQALIAAGANPDAIDFYYGETALHVAVRWGTAEKVQALIGAGANPNLQRTYDGDTVLHSALVYGTRETVQVLIDAGADINRLNIFEKIWLSLRTGKKIFLKIVQ